MMFRSLFLIFLTRSKIVGSLENFLLSSDGLMQKNAIIILNKTEILNAFERSLNISCLADIGFADIFSIYYKKQNLR